MTFSFGSTALTFLAAVVGLACAKPLEPLQSWRSAPVLDVNQTVRASGTIRFVALEGGCWAIQTPGGDYEAVNLPERFRVNGLRVSVVLRGAHVYTFCQIAAPVDVDSVRVL